jgi:tetratricopeptide (TPR) repeat protein
MNASFTLLGSGLLGSCSGSVSGSRFCVQPCSAFERARAATNVERGTLPCEPNVNTNRAPSTEKRERPLHEQYGLVTIALAIASLALPGTASAQHEPLARAVVELRTAMQGLYGDEGQSLVQRIDDVSAALAEWDRSIRQRETIVASRLDAAAPGERADLRSDLGLLYLQRSRFAEALAEFDAAARFAPERAAIRLLRGLALDALERRDEAGPAYREAWTLEPTDPVKAYLALTRSTLTGSTAGSNLPGSDPAPQIETLLVTTRGVVRGVRRRTGVAFFDVPFRADEPGVAAAFAPVFAPSRYAVGFALYARGRYEEAIVRWREAAARDPLVTDPALPTARMVDGLTALRQGRLAAAIAALGAASTAVPASSEAHRVLGTALGLAGNRLRSAEQLEAALRLRPDDERSWIALARTRDAGTPAAGTPVAGTSRASAPADALRTLEAAVQAVPDSAELRWRLAELLVRLERNGDALDQFAQVARLGAMSGQGQVHQAEAVLASMHHDVAATASAVERRVRVNLNDAAAHRDLANVYAKLDRQTDAFAELAIAAWLDPQDPLIFLALGHSHLAARRDVDAVEALQLAVVLAPDLEEARYALAQALTRVGRRDEGLQQLSEFERLRRELAERATRGDAIAAVKADARRQSLAGRHRQAAQTWMKVATLEPALAQNHVEVAEAMVRAGQLDGSIQYFVKAAELDGVAEVHLRLSDVLGRLGRTRESALARETYERLRLEDFRLGAGR